MAFLNKLQMIIREIEIALNVVNTLKGGIRLLSLKESR